MMVCAAKKVEMNSLSYYTGHCVKNTVIVVNKKIMLVILGYSGC